MVIGQMGQHHQPCWMDRGSLQEPQVLWTMLIFLFLTKGRGATSGNEEMEAFSCPQTALVGSLDIILHFVSDERALFPSLGTDRGRFSQERRLFIFTLRWGVRHTTKVWVVSEETWGPEWPGHSGPVSAMGNWCPRKFSCGTSGSTDPSLIRATVSPRPPTSLPSLRTLSLSLSVSLYPGDSVDLRSPAWGAVLQVTSFWLRPR